MALKYIRQLPLETEDKNSQYKREDNWKTKSTRLSFLYMTLRLGPFYNTTKYY